VTVSTILISLSFCYCFGVSNHDGQMDLINNNQEGDMIRKRKKKSDIRRGSVTQTQQSSVSSSRRSSMSITGHVGSMGVQNNQLVGMQARLVATEKELVEIKMRNLKLLKLTENLEEKNRNHEAQLMEYQELKEHYGELQKKNDQSREKIAELETKLLCLAQERERVEKENESLDKMVQDQQRIIKLALARILPRRGQEVFCQEHVGTIREYQKKYLLG